MNKLSCEKEPQGSSYIIASARHYKANNNEINYGKHKFLRLKWLSN